MFYEPAEYENEWQQQCVPILEAIRSKIDSLKSERDSYVNKRDISYEDAMMAKAKGRRDMYDYWMSKYWHYYECAKLVNEALSDIAIQSIKTK